MPECGGRASSNFTSYLDLRPNLLQPTTTSQLYTILLGSQKQPRHSKEQCDSHDRLFPPSPSNLKI